MKKNFLFGTLAVLLAGFWFGGASLADCTATEQGDNEAMLSGQSINYCSLSEAIAAADNGDTVTLLKNITISGSGKIIVEDSIKLNLDGHTITSTDSSRFIFSGNINAEIYGNGTIKNVMTDGYQVIQVGGSTSDQSPTLTLKDGTYISSDYLAIAVYGTLNIENATVRSDSISNTDASMKNAIFLSGANCTIEGGTYNSLSGYAINAQNSVLTISDGTFESPTSAVVIRDDSEIIVNGGIFNSTDYPTLFLVGVASGHITAGTFTSQNNEAIKLDDTVSLVIGGGTFVGGKETIDVAGNPTLEINNGNFESLSRGVIYIEAGSDSSNVTINGGTFTSSTSTAGLIAYGLAASNAGTVTINGGTFDITNGAGIVARGGNVTLSGAEFNFHNSDSSLSGKLATTMYGVEVPVGYELVMDLAFHLNDANAPKTSNFITTNNKTGTYLISGTDVSQVNYIISTKDSDFTPITLSKDGNDVKLTEVSKAGHVWYNVAPTTAEKFDFATAIDKDVTLEGYEVLDSIDLAGIIEPVDGATPSLTVTTSTTGITLSAASWTGEDDLAPATFVAGSGYTLTVPFTVDAGYDLTGAYTATANGGTVTTGDGKIMITFTGKLKVTFDGVSEVLVDSGDKVSKPSDPSKDCNRFDGWFADSSFSTGFDFDTEITGNTVIYPKWTYTCSRSSGGGGSSTKTTTTDTKATTGDNKTVDNNKTDETKADETKTNENNGNNDGKAPATDSKYSQEMIDAYNWAFKNGITTMPSIDEADMEGGLTRIAMAKMLSQYAINILGKTPDTSKVVPAFPDVTAQMDADYSNGVTLAYQLGIMGIGIETFRPNDLVTRAEFATALSRLLFNTPDGEDNYYTTHLQKLMDEKIITVDTPDLQELRGYVMIMLMRSANS